MTGKGHPGADEGPAGLTAEDLERIRRFARIPRHRRTPDLLRPGYDRET